MGWQQLLNQVLNRLQAYAAGRAYYFCFPFLKWTAYFSLCTIFFFAFSLYLTVWNVVFISSVLPGLTSVFARTVLKSFASCHCKTMPFEGPFFFILETPVLSWSSGTIFLEVCWVNTLTWMFLKILIRLWTTGSTDLVQSEVLRQFYVRCQGCLCMTSVK